MRSIKAIELKDYLIGLFNVDGLEKLPEEYGFVDYSNSDISRIGYATNLTHYTIMQAYKNGVQFILSHHDAWNFVFGMKEACIEMMKKYNLASFFIHAALDDADFGTNESLLKVLGLKSIEKFGLYREIYTYGRVAAIKDGIDFDIFVRKVEDILGERVRHWKNHNNKVQKIAVVTGGGMMTNDLKLAHDLGCDTYITGEKMLYTVQYADFVGMNLIVGSHTNTELFGVQTLAEMVKSKFPEIMTIRLEEKLTEG